MWVLGFYRLYISFCIALAVYLFVSKSFWILLTSIVAARTAWYGIERQIIRLQINRDFASHLYAFKQQLGPYGIRLANKAETDWRIKKSLSEVFTANTRKLRKNVEQLQMMDTLFKAGMRPDQDACQLHDCKLTFGKSRLERLEKN